MSEEGRAKYLERQRRYNCSPKGRERSARYSRHRYYRRKEAALCVHCGNDVAITDTRCFGCASMQSLYDMTRIRIGY